MYSNLIDRPSVSHVIPFGVLSSRSCRWGPNDVNLLSIYRPPINDLPGSLRVLTTEKIKGDLEDCIWDNVMSRMDKGPVYLAGDFNLPPTHLDVLLIKKEILARRIPFLGPHHSFRRWDSINKVMQKSSIDHLIWNGAANPQCHLATSGLFTTDHVPVIVNTAVTTTSRRTKLTRMKHNVTLDNSDKGAVRRFIARTNKLVNNV